MKSYVLMALAAALTATPHAVRAQGSTTAPSAANASRREQEMERREAMRQRREAREAPAPEQRAAARTRREAGISAMPAEQQEYLRSLRSYSQSLRERARELQAQVTAGTLTRDDMARQLRAYRDANRPSRPAGMPEPRRRGRSS